MDRRAFPFPAIFGLLLTLGGHAAAQLLDEPHASDLIPPGQKLSADEQKRDVVRKVFGQRRMRGPVQEVVYGPDDRLDRYQVASNDWKAVADSVCSITTASNLASNGDGTYRLLDISRFTTLGGVNICDDERFKGQLRLGFCTGFLVAPDVIATAGHCVDAPNAAFIFGFSQHGPGMAGPPDEFDPTHIPASDVYFATELIDRRFAGELDYSIVRLDRAAAGRSPLTIRRSGEVAAAESLLMIGHGNNLPEKYDGGGRVQNANLGHAFFTANLDAFGGNSGSPVINESTGLVEGILVRGNSDFVVSGSCLRSRVCADGGCPGFEEITRASAFAASVPQIGVQATPLNVPTIIGPVGGPFTGGTVTYTLSNSAAQAASYSVSIDAGGTAPLLINGAPGPVGGVLASGANTPVAVSIAPAATTLPAGSYASTVRIVDLTNNLISTRVHKLEVGTSGFDVSPASVAAISGPAGGPFIGTRAYTVTSTRATPVQVRVQGDQPWIAIDGGSSQTFTLSTPGASRTVFVGASADAASLAAGLYSGTVNFTNQTGGEGSTARGATLEIGRINYASAGSPVSIADRGSTSSFIFINEPWCIGDLDVDVDIAHGFVGDLIVELTSPSGTTVRLKNRTGGDSVNLVGTFDQDGAGLIPDGPGSLTDFDGEATDGPWTLRVTDNASGHAGTINSWAVRIVPRSGCAPIAQDQTIPVPPTLTSPVGLIARNFTAEGLVYRVTRLPAHGKLFDPMGGEITSVPYEVQAGGVEVRYRPALGFAGADSFEYIGAESSVQSAPAMVRLEVGVEKTIAAFNLSSDPGWTRQGGWQFGTPTGAGTDPGDPTSGFTGANVLGYNLAGDYPNGLSVAEYVTTGPIDCSAVQLPRVVFKRWLGVERNAFDRATVQASVDHGATWTTIWINPDESMLDNTWVGQSVALPESAGGVSDVRLRWGMGPTDAIVTYAGWNIDDVRILGLAAPSPACTIDLNVDGQVDLLDFFAFFNAFDQSLPEGDVNGDGQIDLQDFTDFFSIWDVGGCV